MVTEEIRSELKAAGLDYEEVLSRFADNESMFVKFYKKFFASAEVVIGDLEQAVVDGDYPSIEAKAHALKGISGNIGLNSVYNPAKKMVDDMRAGNHNEYKNDFGTLLRAFTRAAEISDRI